jgi:hypothetical protein
MQTELRTLDAIEQEEAKARERAWSYGRLVDERNRFTKAVEAVQPVLEFHRAELKKVEAIIEVASTLDGKAPGTGGQVGRPQLIAVASAIGAFHSRMIERQERNLSIAETRAAAAIKGIQDMELESAS